MEQEIKDFKFLIENHIYHLLPIMGIGKIIELKKYKTTKTLIKTNAQQTFIYFYPKECYNYYYMAPIYIPLNRFPVLQTVYNELLFCNNNYQKHFSDIHKNSYYKDVILEAASVYGICSYLTNNNTDVSKTLISIIKELKTWSQKTYEGRNVPFGFIVDLCNTNNNEKENFIDFLSNEHSAVFTDGVFSAVLLNAHGYIQKYLELTSHEINTDIVPLAPSRFLNFANECSNKKIGIVSLANGNILLFRDQQLIFSYTGGHWVTYGWSKYFKNFLFENLSNNILNSYNIEKDELTLLSKAMYVSILDVSLAHSGGCLAVIDFLNNESKVNSLLQNCLLENMKYENPKLKNYKKTLQKNIVIKNLVDYNSNQSSTNFHNLKNKLRAEIMKLDGATILTPTGEIKAVGAILSVKSGSESGGRLAATKALSKLGVAVKISEDGEITGYKNNIKVLHF